MIRASSDAVKDIVVSTWVGNDLQYPESVAKIIRSHSPSDSRLKTLHNSQNIYLQATSVLAGLEAIDTPYVIKARSDEFFSRISLLLECFHPEKLLTSNIFVRNVDYAKYHISDHLFVGQTSKLREAYRALKAYIENFSEVEGQDPCSLLNSRTPAEVKIGLFYLQSCGYDLKVLIEKTPKAALEVMMQEFDVFDVECMKPYRIRSSVAGDIECLKTFIGYDRRLDLRYIKSMKQFDMRGGSDFVFRVLRRMRGSMRSLGSR